MLLCVILPADDQLAPRGGKHSVCASSTGWRVKRRSGEHRRSGEKKDEANSTDSQFYGINNDIQFAEENQTENFEGERKSVSKYCNSLFRRRSSLFWQNIFPVSAQNRESSATNCNCSANGSRNPVESVETTGNLKNSLLLSLFSVRHRALPDLQGMKAGNGAPSNGI